MNNPENMTITEVCEILSADPLTREETRLWAARNPHEARAIKFGPITQRTVHAEKRARWVLAARFAAECDETFAAAVESSNQLMHITNA